MSNVQLLQVPTAFDPEDDSLVVATPTCCSSCCCCLIAIGVSTTFVVAGSSTSVEDPTSSTGMRVFVALFIHLFSPIAWVYSIVIFSSVGSGSVLLAIEIGVASACLLFAVFLYRVVGFGWLKSVVLPLIGWVLLVALIPVDVFVGF